MAAPTISSVILTGDGTLEIVWSDSTHTFSQVGVPILGANGKLLALDSSGNIGVGSSALPTGAATSARQAAPGTAGSPSTDVTTVQPPQVASPSLTTLSSSASSQQLLAANAARQGLILQNTDANGVYVKYGTTATATSFTVYIAQNGYFEMPTPIYTGRIDAIWTAAGSGKLIATEL